MKNVSTSHENIKLTSLWMFSRRDPASLICRTASQAVLSILVSQQEAGILYGPVRMLFTPTSSVPNELGSFCVLIFAFAQSEKPDAPQHFNWIKHKLISKLFLSSGLLFLSSWLINWLIKKWIKWNDWVIMETQLKPLESKYFILIRNEHLMKS